MAEERDEKTLLTGSLIVLGAAVSLAPITTLARIAYDAGSNPATVITLRYAGACLFMALMVLLLKRSFSVDRSVRLHTLAAGCAWFFATTCYMNAVAFIPVGLAAIILYTFPLLTAAISPWTEGARLDKLTALSFVMAFAGVALAIGPSFQSLDPRGIGLAFLAAIGSTVLFTVTSRAGRRVDGFVMSFWSNASGFVLSLGVLALTGGWLWPTIGEGWNAIGLVIGLYVIAMGMLFLGTRLAGSTRSAMVMNLEPILTLAFAAVLLGEILSTAQFGGGALVIAAVVITTLRRRGKPRLPIAQGANEPKAP